MSEPRALRFRLWMKLAAMAALGVVAMHAIHLTLGNRISAGALATEQALLGRSIARLVADQAADPLLLGDVVSLDSLASSTVAGSGVVYCIILREGHVVASSFEGRPPAALVAARPPGDSTPLVMVGDGPRVLDLVEPILGSVGQVRLGLDMSAVATTRRELAIELGLLAVAVIIAGLIAALLLGRGLAQPINEMLRAADRFDPSKDEETPSVAPRGSDEIAVLVGRFNQMLLRLRAAYQEQERARQKSLETERLVALGSLVAGVTHEVNNPLAGLKNCVHRLSKPELPEPKRQEYLQLMEEGLGRIEEVVKGLLDFARPHPARLEPVPLAELARGAVHLLEPQLKRGRISCRVIADEGDGAVLADRHKVGQALVNLVLNAAWVTANGGEIRLRLRRRDGLRGIAVEDDGPGIPKELRDRILDPFFTTKPPGEGTGLGLSVTRGIVDAHGGELTFDFPPGGGTVATVWLRVLASEPPPAS